MGFFSDVFGGGQSSKGARRGEDISQRAYEDIRADTAPYRRLGGESVNRLRDVFLTGEVPFTASPGYDFRREEGQRAIDRGMAARGLYGSGARGRALARYSDDLASQEYGDQFNRLAAMAGLGGAQVGRAQPYLGQQAQYALAGGRARQSGYDRASGAGINTLAGLAGMYF